MQNTDNIFMKRCLDLAANGLGYTAPNPLVGSVVVHDQRVIGEGYHRFYGQAHAEVNAINAVKELDLLSQSTLYVNLEPCCHYGKTPPCTDLIIKSGIPRVVIATIDPFDSVAGNGISKLRHYGIQVAMGVLKQQALNLNRRFFTFHEKKRPYIILKWAQTADSFIDIDRLPGSEAQPNWITSEKLRMLVHKWRTEEQAIMVGTLTALNDNPRLNVRDWAGPSPLRIVLDQNLTLSASLHLFDDSVKTLVFNHKKNEIIGQTHWIQVDFSSAQVLNEIMAVLHDFRIQSLIVEGGQHLLQAFIDKGLWDEARIFQGSKFFGKGLRAPQLQVEKFAQIGIENEILYWVKNPVNPY